MKTANDSSDPMLNHPLTRCRASVPPGANPREAPTAMLPPARDTYYRPAAWLRLMPVLHQVHSQLGRDMEIGEVLFDIIGDDYNTCRSSPAHYQQPMEAAVRIPSDFTNPVIEGDATGGTSIGVPGIGKTRTLRRLLSQLSRNYAEAQLRLHHAETLRRFGKDEQVDRTSDQLDAQVVATYADKQAVLGRPGSVERRNRTSEATDLEAVTLEQAKSVTTSSYL